MGPALGHAHIQHGCAQLGRFEEDVECQLGFITERFKFCGCYQIQRRIRFGFVAVGVDHVVPGARVLGAVHEHDQQRGLYDFLEDAFDGIVDAIGGAHGDAIGAAGAGVHFTNGSRHAVGAPPIGHVFGVDPGIEDQLERGVEGTGDDQFAIGL